MTAINMKCYAFSDLMKPVYVDEVIMGNVLQRFYRIAACPPSFKVSLNMLRLHRILRPNESFRIFLSFSPVQLIPYSEKTNPNFWLTFICWQVICYYIVDVINKIKIKEK
jgi:hypothetical protein